MRSYRNVEASKLNRAKVLFQRQRDTPALTFLSDDINTINNGLKPAQQVIETLGRTEELIEDA